MIKLRRWDFVFLKVYLNTEVRVDKEDEVSGSQLPSLVLQRKMSLS